jgi:hypothetical protein
VGGKIMKKENQIIEITLGEYKELLEIKGKYEELKQHPEIKYIYLYEPYPTKIIDTTPTVTWKYLSKE